MQNRRRAASDRSHAALQKAQARNRILDLPGSSFHGASDEKADQIVRDQTHAMYPYSYRPIGTKAL